MRTHLATLRRGWARLGTATRLVLAIEAILLCATIVAGCSEPAPAPVDPLASMIPAQKVTAYVAADLPPHANGIDQSTNRMLDQARPHAELYGPFLVEANTIRGHTAAIRTDAAKLEVAADQQATAIPEVRTDEAASAAKDVKIQTLTERAKANLYRYLPVIVFLGVLGLIAAAAMAWEGKFWAAGGAVAVSAVAIGSCLVLQEYGEVIGRVLAALVVTATLAVLLCELWKNRAKLEAAYAAHSADVASLKSDGAKVLTEVVQTAEAAKQKLAAVSIAAKKDVFGDGAIPGGHADAIQSPATKAAVAAVRSAPTFRTAATGPVTQAA